MDLPDFFGLDIGNHSIKVAEIDRKSREKAQLVRIGSAVTPFGVFSSEDVNAKKKLAAKIKEAVENAGINTKQCVAALPEASIFTRLITVPKVEESKLDELIYWEARQYIPLPLANVQTDYIPVDEKEVNGKKMLQLLLIAAPKMLVRRYMDILEFAGLELLALETETIATSRAVSFGNEVAGTLMVMDFGANGTDISVIRNKSMIFSQSLGTGSDAMTKAIAADFNLEIAQAEQYKRAYGLDKSKAQGKIYNSIEPIVHVISNEVNRTLNFFRTQLQNSVPAKILIVGDGSKLINLPEYLKTQTQIDVELYNPAVNLEVHSRLKDDLKDNDLMGYSVAFGLALKIR